MNFKPAGINEIASIVAGSKNILPRGGGTKPLLSTPAENVDSLDMTALSGIITYDPGEFTFTALAGTPVSSVKAQLDKHAQYLPFDPILVKRGATLGGTVAAGINGPGRYRFGGMRDFLLAARFIDGRGESIKSGEKVVKNSAGFDYHKLLIGSLGTLGILVELTFKVFPRPEVLATVFRKYAKPEEAIEAMWQFSNAQLDLDSLDLEITDNRSILWARIGASTRTLTKRFELTRDLLGGGDVLEGREDEKIWEVVREFSWIPPGWYFIKIPITPSQIPAFEHSLMEIPACLSAVRRYSSGGQQLWLAMAGSPMVLHDLLRLKGLSGLVVLGPEGLPSLGVKRGELFIRRVKDAVDPNRRFAEI